MNPSREPVKVSATLRSVAQISRRTALSMSSGSLTVRTRTPRSPEPVTV